MDSKGCANTAECSDGEVCLAGQCVSQVDGLDVGFDVPDFSGRDVSDDGADGGGDVNPTDQGDDTSDRGEDSADASDISEDGSDAGDLVDTNECPGDVNACGGCAELPFEPGAACGSDECGSGVWACATFDTLFCESEEGANGCGGCTELGDEPGDPCTCDGEYQCDDDSEGTTCSGALNSCGGCGELEGEPNAPCGACLDGTWSCIREATAVQCVGASEGNACGGCDELPNEPGDECGGDCGTGEWVCAGENNVSCASDGGTVNACGGCEELEGDPGDACGDCGELVCTEDDESVECQDPGENECGGCETLPGEVGDPCGPCLDGELVCDGTDDLACKDASALNGCGGCAALRLDPGDPCGSCGLDEIVCDGIDNVMCNGDTTVNACDGCNALPDEPGTDCGPCDLDVYECTTTESVACDGTTYGNACNGCNDLANDPGDPCGVCGLDHYVCSGTTATTCNGNTAGNECGGCTELPGGPGDICSCGGTGQAVYACTSEESLSCSDGDELPTTARVLGTGTYTDEQSAPQTTGTIDGINDADFYYADVTDGAGTLALQLDLAALTPAPDGGNELVDYRACIFYRYNDARQGNIIGFTCGISDQCAMYDASADTLDTFATNNCAIGIAGFDAANDLYGCCEDDPISARNFRANMNGIEEDGITDSGRAFGLIWAIGNTAVDSCGTYRFTLAF